jgi:RimJ/RimL family protein N-acetyltransferase
MTEGAFHLQPTLTGELLELRPLRGADFDALFAAASDPLIWEQHPENDRYTREVFQKYFDGAIESGGAFAIIERKSGRIIGSSRYCHLYVPGKCFSSSPHLNPLPQGEEDATAPGEGSPSRRSEVEIGWTFLERAFWGGRYNRELKTLMLDHAFGFVDRVVFVVGENNLRSQKALQKIGARFLRKSDSLEPDGSARLVFAIHKADYLAADL